MKKYLILLFPFFAQAQRSTPNFKAYPVFSQSIAMDYNSTYFLRDGFLDYRYQDPFGGVTEGTSSGWQDNVSVPYKNVRAVSAYNGRSCFIDGDRLRNDSDECVYANEFNHNPIQIKGPRLLAVGDSHGCVIDSQGVKCWGDGYNQSDVPADLKNPTEITAGTNHSCVIDGEEVKCWGDNRSGQCKVPAGLQHPRRIVAGKDHSCALTDTGLVCWGSNSRYQDPFQLPTHLGDIKEVASGPEHICTLGDDGARCFWLKNRDYVAPHFYAEARAIQTGAYGSCILDANAILHCGQTPSEVDFIPRALKNLRQIDIGGTFACGLQDRTLKCWGSNIPADVPGEMTDVDAFANSKEALCVLRMGEVKCFGTMTSVAWVNRWQLQNPRLLKISNDSICVMDDAGVKCSGAWESVDQVPADIHRPVELAVAKTSACAIENSAVKCWGRDASDNPIAGIPVNLSNPRNLSASKSKNTFCVSDDHEVKCWGEREIPVPQNLGNDIRGMAVGGEVYRSEMNPAVCAIAQNKINCWAGEFGPTQALWTPSDIENPSEISMQNDEACVVHAKGVRCWNFTNFERVLNEVPLRGLEPRAWNLLTHVEISLKEISSQLYAHKADFALKMRSFFFKNDLKGEAEFQTRLLALLAMKPFIEDISVASLLPRVDDYKNALSYYRTVNHIEKLGDFAKSQRNIRSVAEIAALALSDAKAYVTGASDRTQLEQLIALAGNVMAQPTRAGEFVRAYDGATEVLTRARNTWEIKGLIETADKLVEFLQ